MKERHRQQNLRMRNMIKERRLKEKQAEAEADAAAAVAAAQAQALLEAERRRAVETEEDELLQECKGQNTKLTELCARPRRTRRQPRPPPFSRTLLLCRSNSLPKL